MLYRGDEAGNSTLPNLYRTEGLHTKLINGGNPAYVSTVGLAESIRVHVSPNSSVERILTSKSSFLSFSSDRKIAAFYSSHGRPDDLVPVDGYGETRYIFALDVGELKGTADEGVFLSEYDCDYSLVTPNTPTLNGLIGAVGVRCGICADGKKKHRLLIIDVVSYISSQPTYANYTDAMRNADRDSEWLVLPVDYVPRLHGFSAKIHRSSVWSAEHFKLQSESPANAIHARVMGSDLTDE